MRSPREPPAGEQVVLAIARAQHDGGVAAARGTIRRTTVAAPAPAIPPRGKPQWPKIHSQASTPFSIAAAMSTAITTRVAPRPVKNDGERAGQNHRAASRRSARRSRRSHRRPLPGRGRRGGSSVGQRDGEQQDSGMATSPIQTPCQTIGPIRRGRPAPSYWATNVLT